jgi:hypothetical protein
MREMLAAGAILGGAYLGVLAIAAVLLAVPHQLAVPVVALLFVGAVAMAWREASR